MKAVMDRDLPGVSSELFAYPETLWEALRNSPPDVLMLSNYVWNEALSLHFAKVANDSVRGRWWCSAGPTYQWRRSARRTTCVASAMSTSTLSARAIFWRRKLFATFSRPTVPLTLLANGRSRRASTGDRGAPSRTRARVSAIAISTKSLHPGSRAFSTRFSMGGSLPSWKRTADVRSRARSAPRARPGIPRSTSSAKNACARRSSTLARRIRDLSPLMHILRLADSNYGMYERDAEISSYFGETQKLYGWPTYIDATTGKQPAGSHYQVDRERQWRDASLSGSSVSRRGRPSNRQTPDYQDGRVRRVAARLRARARAAVEYRPDPRASR